MCPVGASVPFKHSTNSQENNSKKFNKFTLFRPVLWAATLYLPSAASDHLTIVVSIADVNLK